MPKLSFQYVQLEYSETLLEFLVRRFKYHNAAEWEKLIAQGNVLLNGKTSSPGHIMQTRDKLIYNPPDVPEPPVDTSHRIIYEDEVLLAVSKSGNIPSTPSGKYWNNCLRHVLQNIYKYKDLYAVHRLDRETSGINLFTKDRLSAKKLGDDFNTGKVSKAYTAILKGHFEKPVYDVSVSLGKAPASAVHIRQAVVDQGRPSRTIFILKALLTGASLVEVVPHTGRTHQIRAHAEYIGHPVWGDKLYGADEQAFIQWIETGERNSIDRQLLHATRLNFTHPVSGEPLELYDSPEALLRLHLDALAKCE